MGSPLRKGRFLILFCKRPVSKERTSPRVPKIGAGEDRYFVRFFGWPSALGSGVGVGR
jgi:hypothetical protein